MIDLSKYEEYEISEADVDKAIHILSVYDPKNATPEKAVDFLIYLRTVVHDFAVHNSNPEDLERVYKQFTEQRGK